MKVKQLNGTEITVSADHYSELSTKIEGEIISAESENYNESRKIYNGYIDKHPAFIVRCKTVDDVIACVQFAAENDLLTAVMGGGHSGPGFGLCNNGLVIDLSEMNNVEVDAENKMAVVGGGCVWAEVDQATNEFGLATPSGVISTTGVGGLTLGGGLGYLSRKYGLTIDNLLEAEVVLANGDVVTANKNKNTDLFWALRGGGGNFGVVTKFTFQLHPVNMVIGGPTLWHLDQAPKIMKWYRKFMTEQASEDIYGFFAIMKVPPVPDFPEAIHNKTMCGIFWCYTGPKENADQAFAPALQIVEPVLHGVQEMPFPALQSMFDELLPPGLNWYWKADFIKEISDESIEEHMKHADLPSLMSTMHLYPINGATHRVGKNETAWSYRDANLAMVIAGITDNDKQFDKVKHWAKNYWKAIHPYSAGGAYVNMMEEEGDDRIRASYRDNYDRLEKIKTKYDPNNLFRVNQNIQPKVTTNYKQ